MNISKEDYLRVMFELYESGSNCIKSVDIALRLKVTKSSVSQMIRKLSREGLINVAPYSSIRLTRKGLFEAKRIMHSHRIIEVFLKDILNYDLDKVHGEAHRLEHSFSKESIKRLDKFLKNPTISPYGRTIPH